MKSERRHELQHNQLGEWLNNALVTVKPFQNIILASLVLIVVVAGMSAWWMRESAAKTAEAWDSFFNAFATGNVEQFDEVAAQAAGTGVDNWSRIVAGDLALGQGCQGLFSDKATASEDLRKAVEQYMAVLKQTKQPMLRQRATFGLARAYEALGGTRQSQGELDKAIEQYQKLVDTWPEGAYAKLAARRLEAIQSQEIKSFYDDFAEYNPQPASTDQPGMPGEQLPFDLDSLPDGPTTTPDAEESTDAPAADAKPAEAPAADAKPASEGAGQPASEATPK